MHFQPLLAELELASLPSRTHSEQSFSDSLPEALRHQQLLLEVAESSGGIRYLLCALF